jgi:methyl-accepting chemotaxis protein
MPQINLGTIKARLSLLMILSVLGLALATGFGILQMSRFNSSVETNLATLKDKTGVILEVQAANVDFKIQVQEWKNTLLRGNDPASLDKYKKQFQEKAESVQKHLGNVKEALLKSGSPHADAVDKLLASHLEMRDKYLTALQSFDPANPEAGKIVDKLVKGVDRDTTEAMSKLAVELEQKTNDGFTQIVDENQASYSASRGFLLAASALVVALLVAITLTTSRRINRSVTLLQNTLSKARQQLDLTVRVPVGGQDELAQAGMALNTLFDELQSVLKGMRQHAEAVAGSSGRLSNSVGQLSGAVDQQNESTGSMAAAAEELAVSVAHVSDSAQRAQQISQQSLDLSEQGGGIIGHAVATMSSASGDIQSTAEGIEALGLRVQNIGQIANVIKDIADQTNLLALNAAIEAARAGEQGRGFAVVADEVRKLAERTSKATTEIAQVIGAIQSGADLAVKDMRGVVTQFSDIADTTRQAGASIQEIHTGSQNVMGVTQDISSALREQSAASESIAKQIEVIASMSESNSAAMTDVNDAAGTMNQLAQTMQSQLGKFVI